ncbi:MAG: DUF6172 family protein [Candidatus Marinarcus sp.]|uniref:DUF6172 family protein n=1 Tax=Candidatus Marinarcus sp. TaxID=3100987 RepID=UPI003B00CC1C
MKKRFKLSAENKNPERVLDSIKYEIRKYIKREKRKPLPEGVDFWKFECKFAKDDETPVEIDFLDITKCINEAAADECESFYMEIISTQGVKAPKEEGSEVLEEI